MTFKTLLFLLFFLSCCSLTGIAQQHPWSLQKSTELEVPPKWESLPENYLAYTLDMEQMREDLAQSPQAYQGEDGKTIWFPMPDGTVQRFAITQSLTMPEALMDRYPDIRTYQGRGIDHPSQTIRVELTDKGLHAMILTSGETAFVEPYDGVLHIAYWQKDMNSLHQGNFICETDDWQPDDPQLNVHSQRSIDGDLLLYRAAIAGSQEYTAFHGGLTGALGAIAVVLNRVNGIFERELGLQLQLIPNNDLIIYTGPDPYTQGNNGAMIVENQANLDAVIGSANYDIGHLFAVLTAGSVGRAYFQSACQSGIKGGAVSAYFTPIGDDFILPAVAHEMGHQFGASHSFNTSTTANGCVNNRNPQTPYEPGSGSTLMTYAGACPPHDFVADPDDYYHGGSLIQIHEYTRNGGGSTCPTTISSNNQKPSLTIDQGGFVIPISTPFELSALAIDPDGDSITYCWDQIDVGPAGHPNFPVGNAALFRSFQPVPDSNRIFPRLLQVLNNNQIMGEILPDYSRDMNFVVTVRDLQGGVNQAEIEFETSDNAGPFLVLSPDGPSPIPLEGGAYHEITWDVANTNLAPVNCQAVTIHLSVNGGFDFPYLLAESLPNTGSAWLVLPEISSTQCRIRVRAADNIFFDISNDNFSIEAPTQAGVALSPSEDSIIACLGSERDFVIYTSSLLGFSGSVDLSIFGAGLPDGVSGEFSPNPFIPGDTLIFHVTTLDTATIGVYPLAISALAPSAGIADIINLSLVLESLDIPQPIQAVAPVSQASVGLNGVIFSWEEDAVADDYYLQIATSPLFGASMIYENDRITTASYILPTVLQSGTTYYWRVAGRVSCGMGPFGETQAFQTGLCEKLSYDSNPIDIPLFGSPATVSSTINTSMSGTVGSVQVQNIVGSHSAFEQLEMSLTSPAGTEILLFSQVCSGEVNNFAMNFSDNGLSMIDCPPTLDNIYQGQGSFGAFVGENPVGNWMLTIRDITNFDGGELRNWGLEICEKAADAPVLIRNNELQTQQWYLDTIDTNLLEGIDLSGNLTYTIVSLPVHGGLQLNGIDLAIGSQFSQQDIDQGLLAYLNNGSVAEADSFRFDLSNVAGGWSGVYSFLIGVSKNPNTSLETNDLDVKLDVFPNPVGDRLFMRLTDAKQGPIRIELYTIQGQLLYDKQDLVQGNQFQTELPMTGLSSGMYMLKLSHPQGEIYQKVVKD